MWQRVDLAATRRRVLPMSYHTEDLLSQLYHEFLAIVEEFDIPLDGDTEELLDLVREELGLDNHPYNMIC